MNAEKNAEIPRTGKLRPVRMSRKEASRYLKDIHGLTVAPDTLAKKAGKGDGPVFQRFGRQPLYTTDALDTWVMEGLTAPTRSTSAEG